MSGMFGALLLPLWWLAGMAGALLVGLVFGPGPWMLAGMAAGMIAYVAALVALDRRLP